MNWIKKHIGLVLFLSGILLGVSGMLFIGKQKQVHVVVDESKIKAYFKRKVDSLQKVRQLELDSLKREKNNLKTSVKIIYKTIESEKSIIYYTRNIDSLRKSAINYTKSIE